LNNVYQEEFASSNNIKTNNATNFHLILAEMSNYQKHLVNKKDSDIGKFCDFISLTSLKVQAERKEM
jgi:hypothetical protein